MKKIALSFFLVFFLFDSSSLSIPSALGQETRKTYRPKKYSDVVKSANEIRSKEKEIRTFFMQLVLRKAQMDVATILKNKRMADEDIEVVMKSDAMTKFLSRLENNPAIKKKVEVHVQTLVRPGAIEAHVMKQRAQMVKQIQEKMLLARSQLKKSKDFRTTETVFTPTDERTIAKKVWDHAVKDLYKN